MKKLILITMAAAFIACQSKNDDSYTLTGLVDGQNSGMVYLQDRVAGLMINLDSTNIENGTFKMQGTMEYPKMYYLSIEGVPGRVAVYMENSTIELTIEEREPVVYNVKGSQSHDIYMELNQRTEPYDENLRELQKQLMAAEVMDNLEEADHLRESISKMEQEKRDDVKAFIRNHNTKTVSVFIASRQLLHSSGPEELREIFSIFDTSLKGTRYYDEMEKTLLSLERVAIGQPAVDFTINDVDGNEVSLTDYRGQVVLLSFWASWCPYCRVANPDLVNVYEKFNNKNFEVIGVSLDRNHEAWIKGIEEDGLEWIHVSDLKGWQSEPAAAYAIRSIPQNVLIGTDGTILARNLKYDELEEKLEGLLREI